MNYQTKNSKGYIYEVNGSKKFMSQFTQQS
jgi:hypothetical protein